ncbi:hypothetical protein BOX15_Mlig006948g2 [Macrostomum lignano]|uniref:Uncharacterized protein n=1 Tax=Macrostomum lignano TaxID=282301 RepID=A0A267GMH9_9PLAT|nr:hypothetical protein BOX15_Mlig006948g2 [Macrostomum lignano]
MADEDRLPEISEQPALTPEAAAFQNLSPAVQRQILNDYPGQLARAAHGYSLGADCETVLRIMLEGAAPMLRVRSVQGDSPIASALLRDQPARATWLAELATEKNPKALTDRARYGETLAMLSTGSQAAGLLEKLLDRDPTQLHRLYDVDGRNLLHHCSLEDSAAVLEAALRCAARQVRQGELQAAQLAQAVHMNDRRGDTPLHLMAGRNRVDMLRLLLRFCAETGIDINLNTQRHVGDRRTPLMVAAAAGATDFAQLLLDEGADLDEIDADGCSAVQLASGQPRVAALFAGLSDPGGPELEATACGSVQSAPSLVDSGVQSAPSHEQQQRREHPGQLLEELEARLSSSEKSDAFLEAVSRLSNGQFPPEVLLATEKPVTTAFSLWSHSGPVPLRLVLRALREVGEPTDWIRT